MGYSIFKFGAIYLDNKIQPIPQHPIESGDIPKYDGKATISLETLALEDSITWIKPNERNIFVADRVLLADVSWDDLDENGFIAGKSVLIDGQLLRCRLLQVGEDRNVPNEWDVILDETYEDDILWHWNQIFFWGVDASVYSMSSCAVRGYHSARNWYYINATNRYAYVGFRPALEPLPSVAITPNINLDGIDFQLTRIPGGKGFCPILQPAQSDVFKDITVWGRARMYTLVENGRPIHMDEPVRDLSKLTLTDRYFGDEYLLPWVISNGVAVAARALSQKNP